MGEHNADSSETGFFGLPQSRTWAGRIADKIEIALLVFAGGAFVILGVLIVNQVFFR